MRDPDLEAAATWRAVTGQPPVTCYRSHRWTPVNSDQQWRSSMVNDCAPPVNHRRTTGQSPPDHRTTSQRWRSTGQQVPRGSATLARGDPLSNVAPCGDDVEIAKKAMAGFESMTSRS
ncbi:hypothetical protein Tco_0573885 [Tanacetum coccineum]